MAQEAEREAAKAVFDFGKEIVKDNLAALKERNLELEHYGQDFSNYFEQIAEEYLPESLQTFRSKVKHITDAANERSKPSKAEAHLIESIATPGEYFADSKLSAEEYIKSKKSKTGK